MNVDYKCKHYTKTGELVKARKEKLEAVNWRCEICGRTAQHIHHKDGSKSNHAKDNLMALCPTCHYSLHRGRQNKGVTKVRWGGRTLHQWALMTGLSVSTVMKFFKGMPVAETTEELMMAAGASNAKGQLRLVESQEQSA